MRVTALKTRWSNDQKIVRPNPNIAAKMIAIENSTDRNEFEFCNRPGQYFNEIMIEWRSQFPAIRAGFSASCERQTSVFVRNKRSSKDHSKKRRPERLKTFDLSLASDLTVIVTLKPSNTILDINGCAPADSGIKFIF